MDTTCKGVILGYKIALSSYEQLPDRYGDFNWLDGSTCLPDQNVYLRGFVGSFLQFLTGICDNFSSSSVHSNGDTFFE